MYYNIEKITEHIYMITSGEGTFCQLAVGEDKALLFDTGYGFGDLAGAVREITQLPLILVNSHGHLDHINGNVQFDQKAYLHPADFALAAEHSSVSCRREAALNARQTVDHMTGEVSDILPDTFSDEAYIHASMPGFLPVKEGDVFSLGGVRLEVREFPGHTMGSIGLYCPEDGVLLVGDAFSPFTWLFTQESADLTTYIASLEKAVALQPQTLLFGHEIRPLTAECLADYLDCARHVTLESYEKGEPFESPLVSGEGARVCAREGYRPMEFDKKGYASIVISKEHIK